MRNTRACSSSMLPVVILAGGQGVRLRPVTTLIPKALAPVAGKPFLSWLLSLLAAHGANRILLLTGHLGDQIQSFVRDGKAWGLDVSYSHEHEPLGTAGAIRNALALLPTHFILLYGDSYLPIDYEMLSTSYMASGCEAMLATYLDRNGQTDVPPNITVAGTLVTAYKMHGSRMSHIDAGAIALHRSVISELRQGSSSLSEDVLPPLAHAARLCAYECSQRFYDIGTPARLREFERYIQQ